MVWNKSKAVENLLKSEFKKFKEDINYNQKLDKLKCKTDDSQDCKNFEKIKKNFKLENELKVRGYQK